LQKNEIGRIAIMVKELLITTINILRNEPQYNTLIIINHKLHLQSCLRL